MTTGPRASLHRWDELPLERVTEMVSRKAIACTTHTLVQTFWKKGALVPLQQHAHERLVYVLQGAVRVSLLHQADEVALRDGDVLILPPGTPYQAEVLDDTFVFTIRQ